MDKKILIITGPTAVGKTKCAVKIAKKINGEIISADSMQVYKFMNVGTAKPSLKDRRGIKHHLISIVRPDEEFNVAKFIDLTKKAIQKIVRKGKTPIIVGGAGLYLKSLIYGFGFPKGEKEGEIRKNLKEYIDNYSIEKLYKKLKKIDPVRAKKIHPNDRFRIIRALEVYYLTGKPMSRQAIFSTGDINRFKIVCLIMDRQKLYELIDRRVDAMINKGLVREVKSLIKKGYSEDLPSLKAIGYKEVIDYLKGKYNFDEMVRLIKRNSRHLAKKQLTWFRSFPNIIYKKI